MDEAISTTSARKRAWRPLRAFSDAALARAAAAGDGAALGVIFERHHQALYRYCRSLVGNDADAQDALQNAMARAVRALPGEQRDIAVRPWLYRIAHNEAVRLLGSRRPQAQLDEASGLAAPDGADGEAARERLAGLIEDLRELPERQRAALVMRELNGLAFEDIGAALGMSPAAAKQSVYEARVGLQELEQGRAMRCEDVMRAVSDGDRRKLRGRKVRAHLRGCDECRDFRLAIDRRTGELRALAPPLAAPAAAAILGETVGGGSAGGGGLLALFGAGAAKAVVPAAALKAAATVAVVAAAGAGAATLDLDGRPSGEHSVPVRADSPDADRSRTAHPGTTRERPRTGQRKRGRGEAERRSGAPGKPGNRRSAESPPESAESGRIAPTSAPAAGRGTPSPDVGRRPDAGGAPPSGRGGGSETPASAPARPPATPPEAPAPPSAPEPTAPTPPTPPAPTPDPGRVDPSPGSAGGQAGPDAPAAPDGRPGR